MFGLKVVKAEKKETTEKKVSKASILKEAFAEMKNLDKAKSEEKKAAKQSKEIEKLTAEIERLTKQMTEKEGEDKE